MPVISLLQDLMLLTKSPYERYIGKYTQQFCVRINRQKLGDGARKILMAGTISADDAISIVLGVSPNQEKPLINQEAAHLSKPILIKKALKLYLSGLLVLLSLNKELVLSCVEMSEEAFIQVWTQVFRYEQEDRILFNQLLTACRTDQVAGIAQILAREVTHDFFGGDLTVQDLTSCYFMEQVIHDTDWIYRYLDKGQPLSEQGGDRPVLYQ